jgi:sirohydrochlorin cobaltochelatase
MRPSAQRLAQAVAAGIDTIGQIRILTGRPEAAYGLCHLDDIARIDDPSANLERVTDPAESRRLSTYAADGTYRFTKGQLNLQGGWLMLLEDADALLAALDGFYPASVALWLAQQDGRLHVLTLRDKLARQTGMYRFAKNISDAGAQQLIQTVCGPSNQCVKHILWPISPDVPLEDSEASRFRGVLAGIDPARAIPMVCQEACNHFVAEARKVSKAEAGV